MQKFTYKITGVEYKHCGYLDYCYDGIIMKICDETILSSAGKIRQYLADNSLKYSGIKLIKIEFIK